MAIKVSTSGSATEAARRHLDRLVADRFAARLFEHDAGLWGPAAADEASRRLGWTDAAEVSRALVPSILSARDALRSAGVDRIVLCGMGGSSLAPEVMCRTAGIDLVVLDSTDPTQVAQAVETDLDRTAVVVSSKSGSTLETDSQRRVFIEAFGAAGIDPTARLFVVTDPGSPLGSWADSAGYTKFEADPTVGGRFSALTAFGLVPSGLAGLDIDAFLDDAAEAAPLLAIDAPGNPGLVLGAALAGGEPFTTYIGVVDAGSGIVGFGDWAEQLIAESTGKDGRGMLPVVLTPEAPEIGLPIPDLRIVRLVADAETEQAVGDEITVSGPLAAQMLLWEVAVSVAGAIIGINPFDQPDVESAKVAARALLDEQPVPQQPAFVENGIAVRGSASLLTGQSSLEGVLQSLLASLPAGGYVSIQAYANRLSLTSLAGSRDLVARRTHRPTTFGWGPRFLHSTGQFHKGGPRVGVFLQITTDPGADFPIPERPFGFLGLIHAQAEGDASVLEDHGMPVLRLELENPATGVPDLIRILESL